MIRKTAEHASLQLVDEQLEALFSADGVSLDADMVPASSPPTALTLERDTQAESKMAAYLLGSDLSPTDRGGGVHAYSGSTGAALFRSNGHFDVAVRLGELDIVSFLHDFCKAFGYEDLELEQEDGSWSGTAVQYYNEYPVANCLISISMEDSLLTLTGTYLPDSYTAVNSEAISARAALLVFLESLQETGAVVSAVTDIYPCYELQSTSSESLSLSPGWCIVTDTVNYYVNAISGAIDHE